jgi:hypothetical protein
MDMRDKIAAEHDKIIHATIDEPTPDHELDSTVLEAESDSLQEIVSMALNKEQ